MNASREKKYCPDCGPVTVPHRLEYASAWIDGFLLGLFSKPDAWIQSKTRPFFAALRPGRLAPTIGAMLNFIGLARIAEKPDEKNNGRATALWEEALRRGIVMREIRPFGASREIFYASYGGDVRAFDGLPRPRSANARSLDWMDDKGIILKKLGDAGIPVPRGGSCKSVAEALAIFKTINGPVVVKPHIGSRSRHTYVDVRDEQSLRRAFEKANQLSPRVVVEEELQGFVFRVTLVGGEVAGVMRREPAHVTGDDIHTITELIAMENENPLRNGPIFHALALNDEAIGELAKQSLATSSVPRKNTMVIINAKVSRAVGASTTEIENVHPENIALFKKIAATLDDPLVGVDFMMNDMERPWREQMPCGVIECNSLPFIDLHEHPLRGPARNVAGDVWNLIFPKSNPRPNLQK